MNFSPFSCPIFLGHREARGRCSQGERVLYGRVLCCVWEEPGKQKPRSCRAQELARSSAQENEWQKKGGLLDPEKIGARSWNTSATMAEKWSEVRDA